MARWQAGEKDEARRALSAARELFARAGGKDEGVRRLLSEADALVGGTDPKDGTDKPTRPPAGSR
jgi:hypothetical protein